MQNEYIDWEQVPDELNKEQFYRLCHISKSTALYLLQSGRVPCEYSGKKTRCYKIKKEDVKDYLDAKNISSFSAPKGGYGCHYTSKLPQNLPAEVYEKMKAYYEEILDSYADILSVEELSKLIGYGKSAINGWCRRDLLRYFRKGNKNYIPKAFLSEFFCSFYFRSISRKSEWHKRMMWNFDHKYGKNYLKWHYR